MTKWNLVHNDDKSIRLLLLGNSTKINKIDQIDRHLVKDGLNTKIYNVKFFSNELQFLQRLEWWTK